MYLHVIVFLVLLYMGLKYISQKPIHMVIEQVSYIVYQFCLWHSGITQLASTQRI